MDGEAKCEWHIIKVSRTGLPKMIAIGHMCLSALEMWLEFEILVLKTRTKNA